MEFQKCPVSPFGALLAVISVFVALPDPNHTLLESSSFLAFLHAFAAEGASISPYIDVLIVFHGQLRTRALALCIILKYVVVQNLRTTS